MAELRINLWSGLRRLTGGQQVVRVQAHSIGTMLEALVAAYPGLEPVIEAGVSVAVDGQIVTGDLHHPLTEETEIFLLQQLKGG